MNEPIWLVIDDDPTFAGTLARSLGRRGIEALTAHTSQQAMDRLNNERIRRCVLDLNLAGESGLQLLPRLLEKRPGLEVLVLTGYGSIATAVETIRKGAINYLCKPVTVGQIMEGFEPDRPEPALRSQPPSVEELEWEHIQRVLAEQEGNVSATARALNMHRRTLQRKLAKHSRWRE
ncbi:two-component system, response regulator RegA [Marinobacter daqiaonensis]|uniref:Two-component system, response regulator RegA n=1 Tax=Marinobacter daqiaonensis TaxID=650891 RepID=A0A1I6I798_9GAMM|nr:response regulator [Marinobacter daqiaonensis]SFR62508.1 two-component system, response regulator RegA [Marinobacter daqiaonensis]